MGGKSTWVKNLFYTDYRMHRIAIALVTEYMGPDIGPVIVSFLQPPFHVFDKLKEYRRVIRQNCVDSMIHLLKESQDICDEYQKEDLLKESLAIQSVAKYGSHRMSQLSFDN